MSFDSFETEGESLNLIQQDEAFPQYLCKTCGRCCRSITTFHPYEKLLEMATKVKRKQKFLLIYLSRILVLKKQEK